MVTIYIEGTSDERAGKLRIAFSLLLSKSNPRKRFKIVMGDDKGKTIQKFQDGLTDTGDQKALLTDLDASPSKAASAREKLPIAEQSAYFLMIQEVEAWFFSQPQVLKDYYKKEFTLGKFEGKRADNIPSPSDVLANLTSRTQKGKYDKVRHACDLLPKLDIVKLAADFEDVRNLIAFLK